MSEREFFGYVGLEEWGASITEEGLFTGGLETDLEIKIIDNLTSFDSLEDEWNMLTERTNYSVYQTFDWNRGWWEHYGKQDSLFILTFYAMGQLVGIIPLFWDRITLLGWNLYSGLRLLGSNVSQPKGDKILGLMSYSTYLNAIIDPDYQNDVYDRFGLFLSNMGLQWDELLLEEVPEKSTLLTSFLGILKRVGLTAKISNDSIVPTIDLSGTWHDYLSKISKNSRSHARRALKKVEEGSNKVFNIIEVDSEEEVSDKFERFVEMHQERWNRKEQLGVFAEQRIYQFYKDIIRRFYIKGWLQLKLVVPVDQHDCCVAIDLNFKYKNRVYGEHCALDDQSQYYKMGAGTSLLNATLHEITKSDASIYDLGRGDYSYKQSKCTKTSVNKIIAVSNMPMTRKMIVIMVKYFWQIKRSLAREFEIMMLFHVDRSPFKGTLKYCSFFLSRMLKKTRLKLIEAKDQKATMYGISNKN